MDTWYYKLLMFIHISSAITAVGANVTYGVWSVRARHEPEHVGFALKGIKFIDDRIANPAYGVVFLTGVGMVVAGHWAITTLWIVIAVVLFLGIALVGFAYFTPLMKTQLALVDAGQATSPEFAALSRRNALIGPALGVLVLLILAMMVFKPAL